MEVAWRAHERTHAQTHINCWDAVQAQLNELQDSFSSIEAGVETV